MKEGSSIFNLNFCPFDPSNVPSIVAIWSVELPFPTKILLPTTDILSRVLEATATVLSLVVSLLASESFYDKSICDPEKKAVPPEGNMLFPKSINLFEFDETSSKIKFS